MRVILIVSFCWIACNTTKPSTVFDKSCKQTFTKNEWELRQKNNSYERVKNELFVKYFLIGKMQQDGYIDLELEKKSNKSVIKSDIHLEYYPDTEYIYLHDLQGELEYIHSFYPHGSNALRVNHSTKTIEYQNMESCNNFLFPFFDYYLGSEFWLLGEYNVQANSFKDRIEYKINRIISTTDKLVETEQQYIIVDKKSENVVFFGLCRNGIKMDYKVIKRGNVKKRKKIDDYLDTTVFKQIETVEDEHNFDTKKVQLREKYKSYKFMFYSSGCKD